MPIFDWTRTDLFHPVGDGSTALFYQKDMIKDDYKAMAEVGMNLVSHLLDLVNFPNLTGELVVQRPDDAGHAGDLPDVAEFYRVVSFAVPAPAHLHGHNKNPHFL